MSVADRLRTVLPTEVRVIAGRLRRPNRVERRAVERHLTIPPSLKHARRRPGSIWGVAMMRNEADTARHVIEHMFAQEVDVVLVAENDSTDATPEILSSLGDAHPVHVVPDSLVAYSQDTKMTVLSTIARRCGADWIVPFDADELWFAEGRSVGALLRANDATVVRAQVHNVFPRVDDDPLEADPFLRLRYLDPESSPFRKVAFRSHPLAKISMGNVDVLRRGRRSDGLFIAHYPWRSFDQMADKLRHGRSAMAATTLPEAMNFHWRIAGGWSDERLESAWNELLAGRAVDELAWSPIGSVQLASPGIWHDWGQWAGSCQNA